MLLAGSTRFLFLRAGEGGGRAAGAGRTPHTTATPPPRSLGLIRRVCDHFTESRALAQALGCYTQYRAARPSSSHAVLPRSRRAWPHHLILLPSLVFPHSDPSNKAMQVTDAHGARCTQSLGHTAVVWAQGCNHADRSAGKHYNTSAQHRPLRTRYRFARLPSG